MHLWQLWIPNLTFSAKSLCTRFCYVYEKYFDLAIIPSIRSTGEGKHLTTCIRSILQPIFQKLGHGNSQQSLLFWKILVPLAITWPDLLSAFLQTQSHASVVFCKCTACWAACWPNTLSSFQLTLEFKIKFLTGPCTHERKRPFRSHWFYPPLQKHKRQSFAYPCFTWNKNITAWWQRHIKRTYTSDHCY